MSLRLRVVLLIGAVLMISMALGIYVAGYQAKRALRAELGSGLLGAEQTVNGVFEDLPSSDHQARDLRQLVATFDGNRHVKATLLDADGQPILQSQTRADGARAPEGFIRLLGAPPKAIEIRVPEAVRGFFAIRLTPTPGIDVGGTWEAFLGVVTVLAGSALAGLVMVYFVISAGFAPLRLLSFQFARIGTGDYAANVDPRGPPELISLQHGFNAMAEQLASTMARNRLLTDQLLTIQDEERADIARDLNDEIGPHLFGVSMDAEMITKLVAAGRSEAVPEQARSIQKAVRHMQRQVRDLLGRLRPTHVTEFGLRAALTDLATFWSARRPEIVFELDVPSDETVLPDRVKEAAYRIVQEAANNAIRHGAPRRVQICLETQINGDLVIMIFDDGEERGGRDTCGGLGLLGMRARVAALGGSLFFGKTAGARGWSVVARVPIVVTPQDILPIEALP